jgi:hypothetical protein
MGQSFDRLVLISFDMLVPLIGFREANYAIDITSCHEHYFFVHKLVGILPGGVMVAGIGGLVR